MGRMEIFRVGGIPIVLDFLFVLLAGLWSWPYWSGGSATAMSAGFVLMLGLFVSILLHELGHAWAGRFYGVGTREIELNGLGGLCFFERSLPTGVLPRTVIGLAGPFANLVLWQLFDVAADASRDSTQWLAEVLAAVSLPVGVGCFGIDDAVRAVRGGADYVVIGHPLISGADALDQLKKFVREVKANYQPRAKGN